MTHREPDVSVSLALRSNLSIPFVGWQALVRRAPSDAHPDLIPAGEAGKTEAWVVIEAGNESSIYAGLQPDTTASDLRNALADETIVNHLVRITPKPGDGVFIPAGTVHTLGGDVVVFEIRQNSDLTFRLCDWGHVDAKTGQQRPLQVDQYDFEFPMRSTRKN